jgi:hypothetical protein
MTTADYHTADLKPTKTLVNYNTVRPAPLRCIYEALTATAAGTVSVDRLERRFAFDDPDHLDDCVQFLHAVDFLERPEDRVVTPINEAILPDASFEAKLAYHLSRQDRPQDHLARALDVAFDAAGRTVGRDLLETHLKRDLEYINWNSTKVNMWYRLYEGIGALGYVDSRGLVLSPSGALLYELLATFVETHDSTDFGEAVAWIDEWFLPMLSSRSGTARLHQGVTDTLQNLIDDDVVEVRGMADAQGEVVLPPSHSRREEPAIKEFRLSDPPTDEARYRHPFDQFLEVGR